MIPRDAQLVQLGPWPAGGNNLTVEHSVPRRAFREGVNVVVADDGKVRRRDGYDKVFDAVEPHSGFGYGARGFFAEGTELRAIELYPNGSVSEPLTIFEGLAIDEPLAHCLIEPDIYVSDGTVALRISPTNTVSEWALPTPPAPAVSALAGGAFEAGRYQFALAYRAATGEESGLSSTVAFDLTDTGGFTLSFPAGPASAAQVLVYMTKPNGAQLMFARAAPAAATTITLTPGPLTRMSPTAGMEPLPAGRFAAYFAGRLLVAVADAVFWSEPMLYALTAYEHNYALFGEPVTGIGVVGETAGGFFVGQMSRVYFARGENPAEARLEEVYPAGMVPGTLTHVPGARLPMENPPTVPVPVWLATNGVICAGMPDGSIAPLTETTFATKVGDAGASVFVQRDGENRLVVTTRNPSENVFAVTDSVSIEVVRNGITP